MSIINHGSQTVLFDFKNLASGSNFNKLLAHMLKPGFYRIASPITNSGNTITIPPFTIGFDVSTHQFVHITTSANVTQTAIEGNGDTLVATYTWIDTADNYIDFAWRASGASPLTNEIILCQVTYDGGVVNSVDSTVQTKGIFIDSSYNLVIDTAMSIGKNSNPVQTLDVNGTMDVTGAVTLGSSLVVTGIITLSDVATFLNTGLHILDTDASHDLIIKPGSDLSADRTLTLTTGDADRTLTLSGNLTVESASLINQDLTSDANVIFNQVTADLIGDTTGDVTGGATKVIESGSSIKLNMKVFDIGDWNMDLTATVNVVHDLSVDKIRKVYVIVRGDIGSGEENSRYPIDWSNTLTDPNGSVRILGVNVSISRRTSGQFDDPDFNATSFNRGWITIWYTD